MAFDPGAVREFERAGWNCAAGAYEASFAGATRQFIAPLLEAAAIEDDAAVLDLCCGPGFVTAAAEAKGAAAGGTKMRLRYWPHGAPGLLAWRR
jgi:hypothetical protein